MPLFRGRLLRYLDIDRIIIIIKFLGLSFARIGRSYIDINRGVCDMFIKMYVINDLVTRSDNMALK